MTETEQQRIFDLWISDYRALLYKVIRAYGDTESDREDLFQEISIQIWRSVPNFREDCAISTWLYRISLNTALKWAKKSSKHSKGHHSLDVANQLLAPNEIDDRLDWLYTEIHKLGEVEKSLTLLMLDGYSYKEMAEIMGISENYVGVKINRIKKHLVEKSKGI